MVVCFDLYDLIFITWQTEANHGFQGLTWTYFIQLIEDCQVLKKYSVSLMANFLEGEAGIHVFSGKAVLKVILGRPWTTQPRHQGYKHVVSLGTDKSRARKNQSFYRQFSSAGLCLTLRCDVGTSPGICL